MKTSDETAAPPDGEETRLSDALAGGYVPLLLMSLTQLTGDDGLLERCKPFIRPAKEFTHCIPGEIAEQIRGELRIALRSSRQHQAPLSAAMFQRMMSALVGENIPQRYMPLLMQEFHAASEPHASAPALERVRNVRVLVIGAGLSGVCAGIKLKRAGIDFEIVEKSPRVGGVWQENEYPGCGVDTASHLYSFSFEPNSAWSRYYARQEELRSYIERCAAKYGLGDHLRLGQEVVSLHYAAETRTWRAVIKGSDGRPRSAEFNAVISAVGQLNQPSIPAISGLDTFEGPVVHTARWDKSLTVEGKRVALIGTGASALQVGPAVAPVVKQLTIFQRSAPWVLPRHNFHQAVPGAEQWLLARLPYYGQWFRMLLFWAFGDGLHHYLQKDPAWTQPGSISPASAELRAAWIRYIEGEVGDDPELLAKVVPDYPPFGKRSLKDTHWYRMLKRDHVELVTCAIEDVSEKAIRTSDGRRHEVDAIILATGFHASRMLFPMEIVGSAGRSLRELWGEENPRAYLGITVPEFPNLFLMYGPNTNLGHGGNIIFHAECQARYIIQCLDTLRAGEHRALECRREVHDAYNTAVDRAHAGMVWTHPGVSTWYRNSKGRVTTNSPWRLVDYWEMTRHPNWEDFIFT